MNVLSLFDGMSCGQQALERAGFKVDNYFASEIDKYAIQVTMANYPNTKQLGSVVNVDGHSLPKIDILIGGSPCQSFSFAGKRKGMSTKDEQEILTLEHYLELKAEGFEFEGQSYLFWEYMRLLNEIKPKYFLLENVMMGEKWEKVLSKAIGVKPIMINSALVSAQNRQRLYWTNIGLEPAGLFGHLESTIRQPKNKKIFLKDILEQNVPSKFFLSDKIIKGFLNKPADWAKCFVPKDINGKSDCLTTGQFQVGNNYIITHNLQPRSSDRPSLKNKTSSGGHGHLQKSNGKTYCLDTGQTNAIEYNGKIRRLTPIEYERLQTVKDNYTSIVSDTQRFRMLGNGWTVDVIAHILKYMK
jgi:DNA (cytosine-5)-methyltransferase 3A